MSESVTLTAKATRSLAALLEESSLSWTVDGSGWRVDAGTVSIRVETDGERAVFSSELVRWEALAAPVRQALRAFLEELNLRWQPGCGSMHDDNVLVQVVVSAAEWSPDKIDRVVEDLLFAHRGARTQCMALLHEQVAKLYLQFHKGDEGHHGDHDD